MIEIPEFKELQFKEDTHTYTVSVIQQRHCAVLLRRC